jgi:glutathione S-transferase
MLVEQFLGDGRKFIGGASPTVADYNLVPLVTMMVGSAYWHVADERVKQYVADFQSVVKSWQSLGAVQTAFVASKAVAKPVEEAVVVAQAKKVAKPSTLYYHPVSGNALGCALYATEKMLQLGLEVVDILAGEQLEEWFLALNPLHQVYDIIYI